MPTPQSNLVDQLALQIQLMPLNVAVGVAVGYVIGHSAYNLLVFAARKLFRMV